MNKKFVKVSIIIAATILLILGAVILIKVFAIDSKPVSVTIDYSDVYELAKEKAQELVTDYGATSVQYALIDNSKIVISGQAGVYSREDTEPLTNDNVYDIGSLSKMFTAAAVMQLVDKGKIKLDAPITEYIPEFTMADSRYKDITVRMLLNHSSGLLGGTYSNSSLFDDYNADLENELLDILSDSKLKADPGEFSVYCNDGFTLAELLIERVSGGSYSDYLSKKIVTPLALQHTWTPIDDFDRSDIAKIYLLDYKSALPTENICSIGAGGIYSSAEDLCSFAKIFFRNSSSKVLSKKSAKLMENGEYLNGIWPKEGDNSLLNYGLGWDCVNSYPFTEYGMKAIIKGGDTSFSHGSLIVLPDENMAMAILTSGCNSTVDHVMAQNVMLSALKTKGYIAEINADRTFTAPTATSLPEDQKKYEGIYADSNFAYRITLYNNGILKLYNITAPSETDFQYAGQGKYYSPDGSRYVSFVEESNGNTYLLSVGYITIPNIGQIADSEYIAQKLRNNPISQKVKDAWEKRLNKKFFIINEKYSSELYSFGLPMTERSSFLSDLEGYIDNLQIIDENNAKTLIQIPGISGRDLKDCTFYVDNGVEYLKCNGFIEVSEDAVERFPSDSFSTSIGEDGYAKWYMIGTDLNYKSIQVTMPKEASFSIYDLNGKRLYCTLISSSREVNLPSGGYIVFAGSKNSEFSIEYK